MSKRNTVYLCCLFLLSLCAALCGYFSAHQILVPAEPALRLACATIIAEGGRPYIDFLDNATPFTLYLFTLPVFIAKIFHFHPILIFNFLFALLTLATCRVVISSASLESTRRLALVYYLPAIICSIALIQIYFVLEFGQESMFFVLLFLPYLVERFLTCSGAKPDKKIWIKITAGISAACGMLLNPVFLVALPAVEFTCLTAFKSFTLTKIKHRWLSIELISCVAALLFITIVLFLLAPPVMAAYCGPILNLNLLSYEYFNDMLGYVGKSPDRRDLVYAFVVFFIISLPAASRCLMIRLFLVMSALGFVWLVVSGTLYSHQAITMTAFVLCAFLMSLFRYLRSMRRYNLFASVNSVTKLIEPALNWLFAMKWRLRALLLTLPLLILVCVNQYVLTRVDAAQLFDLKTINYYGFGIKHDLSFYSDIVEKYSAAKDLVWIFSGQPRPAYPLLTQLHRRSSYLIWGFPLHSLKIMHERATPDQMAPLLQSEMVLYDHLRAEINSVRPPKLILIEEGEVWDLMKANKIVDSINAKYDQIDSCSPSNTDEIEAHRAFEYIGHRLGFTTFKLRL